MGVPTITLARDCHRARVGVSLLTNLALQDLIAHSEDDYIALAARLAPDRARLTALRSSMREKMLASPLCNRTAFVAKLEAAYREMWHHWCSTPA